MAPRQRSGRLRAGREAGDCRYGSGDFLEVLGGVHRAQQGQERRFPGDRRGQRGPLRPVRVQRGDRRERRRGHPTDAQHPDQQRNSFRRRFSRISTLRPPSTGRPVLSSCAAGWFSLVLSLSSLPTYLSDTEATHRQHLETRESEPGLPAGAVLSCRAGPMRATRARLEPAGLDRAAQV